MLKNALVLVVLTGVVASAQAVTIATHFDPAANGSTPLFFVNPSTSVSGSWAGTGLTLHVPVANLTFNDVKMDMALVTASSPGVLNSGTVKFYTTSIANPIFQVDFNSASIFAPFGFGGSFVSGQNVTFSGSAVAGYVFDNEQFSFSFANPVSFGNDGVSYTASFTSSADVVPEPATMVVLGLGLAAFARRKRN